MKTLLFTLAILTALITGSGCKKEQPPQTPATNAELRIFNATPWILYDCTIDPGGTLSDNPGPKAYNFGEVDINAQTAYKNFTRLYRYSWVRLTMNGKAYYLKPYDYTGETALESGKYAYKLTYISGNDQLSLELIRE